MCRYAGRRFGWAGSEGIDKDARTGGGVDFTHHLVGVFHELVLNQRLPHPHSVIVILVMSTLSLTIGYSVFRHHRDRFADLV